MADLFNMSFVLDEDFRSMYYLLLTFSLSMLAENVSSGLLFFEKLVGWLLSNSSGWIC